MIRMPRENKRDVLAGGNGEIGNGRKVLSGQGRAGTKQQAIGPRHSTDSASDLVPPTEQSSRSRSG